MVESAPKPKKKVGRRKGYVTKAKSERLKKLKKGGDMPLEYFLKIMRDDTLTQEIRIDAGKTALPFCSPRLNATTVDAKLALDVTKLPKEALELIDRLGTILEGLGGSGHGTTGKG